MMTRGKNQVIADQRTIDWDAIIKQSPDVAGYALGSSTQFFMNDRTFTYLPDGQRAWVKYHGVDSRGRNLGLMAMVNATSHSRRDFYGEPATGDYPYFKPGANTSGLHRGHLLARSLQGRGDRLNWVPLKGPMNLREWDVIEKPVFDHINNGRGHWARIDVTPEYDQSISIPIPSKIIYAFQLFAPGIEGEPRLVGGQTRELNQHLKNDDISEQLKSNWR